MAIPVRIPESMTEHSNNKEKKAWLERLPELVACCEQLWDLRPAEPLIDEFVWMKANYIVPAVRSDGTEVVLKVMESPQTFACELEALELSGNEGCVEILASDRKLQTLMLERVRPGIPLAQQPDDEQNTRIAARVMQKLWRPAPAEHGLQTVEEQIASLARLRQRFDGGTGPVPEGWVARAEEAFEELLATSQGPVILHGDLHHWNILSAEREPWLAIDPHGKVGDRGYDIVSYLSNKPSRSCDGTDDKRLMSRRADILAEELGMIREWVLTWGWATDVLTAAMYTDEWEGHIRRANTLASVM